MSCHFAAISGRPREGLRPVVVFAVVLVGVVAGTVALSLDSAPGTDSPSGLATDQNLTAGPISPSNPQVDDNQSIELVAAASGGLPPYSYAWYEGTSSEACTSGTQVTGGSSTYSTNALPVGGSPYYYCYAVTDSSLQNASSPWDPVTVNPGLTAPAPPGPGATQLDRDQALAVKDDLPTDGTSTYSWQWLVSSGGGFGDASPCGTSASGSGASAGAAVTCTIPANTLSAGSSYSFELSATDSGSPSETVTSGASASVAVSAALSAGSVSPSSPSIDSGQSITLTANPSGGTVPYGYQWFSASGSSGACDAGTALGTAQTQSVSPSLTTYYCYRVTDSASAGESDSSGWDGVTVNSPLAAGSPTPSSVVLDYGQSTTLSAHPSGGTPPYKYQWYWASDSTGSCSSGSALSSGATQRTGSEIGGPAIYYYCYVVGDTPPTGGGADSAASGWDAVTVSSALVAPAAPHPSASAIDLDQPLSVSAAIPSTGSAPFQWDWKISVDGGAFGGATECTAKGGSGAAAGATVSCTIPAGALTSGHRYAFELTVSDSATSAATATSAASSYVPVRTSLTPPGTPTVGTTSLDANLPLNVTDTLPSNGTPPYSWRWLIASNSGTYANATECGTSENGFGAAAGTLETCAIPGKTLAALTNYTFELRVTDNASSPESVTSSSSSTVVTTSDFVADAPSPAPWTLDLGQSVTLTANASGGRPPYVYQWFSGTSAPDCTALGSPVSGASSATYAAAPAISTYYCYEVADASSASSVSNAEEISVHSALTVPTPPRLAQTLLNASQSTNVTAILPTTGSPPYTWTWLVAVDGGAYAGATQCAVNSSSGGNAGGSVTCYLAPTRLAAGHDYAFELQVTDSASRPEVVRSTPSPMLTVGSPPGPGGQGGSSETGVYSLLGLLALILIALGAFAVYRARKRQASGSRSGAPYRSGGEEMLAAYPEMTPREPRGPPSGAAGYAPPATAAPARPSPAWEPMGLGSTAPSPAARTPEEALANLDKTIRMIRRRSPPVPSHPDLDEPGEGREGESS